MFVKKSNRLISKITDLIGNTPIIKIDDKLHGLKGVELYAKLEYLNPFGSLKDRTAKGMLDGSIEEIKAGEKRVIETSSGNTAKALQCICNINGIEFTTVTNRIRVSESKNILKFIGVDVFEVPKGVDTVAKIEEMCAKEPAKYYHTTQYTNPKNVATHKKTGQEILDDIGSVDYFFHVLGTSGSGKGITETLKADNPHLKKIGVVTSAESYIPGIRSMLELNDCGFFSKEDYDAIEGISAEEAKIYMKRMCRGMGILAGVSSGASFAAAVRVLKKREKDAQSQGKVDQLKPIKAVFVVCDRLETYANFIKENRFHKYHALGNTYIIIDAGENPTLPDKDFIVKICHKEFGAGADGLIYGPFIIESKGDDFSPGELTYEYRAFNKDGSEVKSALFATMIFAKYLKDKEAVKENSIRVKIANQTLNVDFLDREATNLKVTMITEPVVTGIKQFGGKEYINVYLGNENLVREEETPTKESIIERGEEVHASGEFPDGVNIQLVKVISKKHIQVETYDRGVGYALASGTSVMASCFAVRNKISSQLSVHTPGGICTVNLKEYSITAEVFKILEGEFEI